MSHQVHCSTVTKITKLDNKNFVLFLVKAKSIFFYTHHWKYLPHSMSSPKYTHSGQQLKQIQKIVNILFNLLTDF